MNNPNNQHFPVKLTSFVRNLLKSWFQKKKKKDLGKIAVLLVLFHTVCLYHIKEITDSRCGNFGVFPEIPSNQLFTKALYTKSFWRKKLLWQWISRFPHCGAQCTVWKNERFGLTEKIFRLINSSDLFSKTVAFTKFLPKKCETKFP